MMQAHDWPQLDGLDERNIVLETWTIYDRPFDYPEHVVVRRWFVIRGTPAPVPDVVPRLARTVEAARALVPPHRTRIPRQPSDDALIVEHWV